MELLHICGADGGSHYLAAAGLGQLSDELDNAGIFIRGGRVLDMVLYLLDKLVARLIAHGEDNCRLDDLASVRMRQSGDCALEHGRMLHQRTFDLERSDAVAGALDNIVVSADVPVVAVAVAPCGVAGVIISELESLLHRGIVFPVVAEKSGRMTLIDPDADRTDHTVLALLAVFVEQSDIIAGCGLAH